MTTHLCDEEPILEQLRDDYERHIAEMLVGGQNYDKKKHMLNHLNEKMFRNAICRQVYKACKSLNEENKIIEVSNVCEHLKKEEIRAFCLKLNEQYITNSNCDFYLEKLLNLWLKDLLKECVSFEQYREVEKLKEKYSLKKNVKPISAGTDELILEYFNKWGKEVKTYYPQIDKVLGTLQGGDILILAGATGMGKTCMALNLLLNMALNGKKCLIFSLEMGLRQLQNRVISAFTGVNADKIRKFTMSDDDLKKYSDFALSKDFTELPIDVCTEYNITTDAIGEVVKSVDPDIVFIDYLGLIKSETTGTIYEKTSETSRRLKLLANETNKPFIVLHQLSRIPQERKQKRPVLSDLRDSGKIEQDADFICFVYRDAYYNSSSNPYKMEFIIAKSRHSSGKKFIDLTYNAEIQLITDPMGDYMEKTQQWT